jgi:4'-phosphopantetheinyl transferase
MSVADYSPGRMRCRWQALPPDRLAVARAWLQDVAGPAAAATLHRDARSRPRLDAGHGDIGWSHTGGRLLMAYAPAGHVGVDVEACTRRVRPLPIARRYFAPEEAAALEALPPGARTQAFLHLWCAKEAVLKACGHGLAFGMHRLAVAADGPGLRITRCDPALGRAADWTLQVLAPDPHHLAVLAWHPGILPA